MQNQSCGKAFLNGHCKQHLPCVIHRRYKDLAASQRKMLLEIDRLHGSAQYLQSLESVTFGEFDICYASFEIEGKLLGMAVFQRSQVSIVVTQSQGALSQLVNYFINSSQGLWTGDVLNNGDIYGTGIKGYVFKNGVDESLQWYSLLEAGREVCKKWNFKPHFLVFRDYLEEQGVPFQRIFRKSRFHQIRTEPAMIMPLPSHWKSFEDYTADLKTKYRTKVKASLERISVLEKRTLSTADIEQHLDAMAALYRNVYEKSDFRPGKFNPQTFYELSKNMGANCRAQAYFLEGEMIAFQMGLSCCDHLDSMFVGMNYNYLKSHALLPGMLCEFIRWGIELGVSEIRFGRTAAELKSSLGAKPHNIISYSRHTNAAANHIMAWVIDRVQPPKERIIQAYKTGVAELISEDKAD